ncbi:M81 family metallopeptidase [Actomonas aquatica]|uniref:M81 family metallopeptidase n=1 Tax=Actomonas aquatica TaxID=2866162 RepID=UPI0031B88486
MRIAVMTFSHETVTFLPYDTTIDDFTYEGSPAKREALLQSGSRSYMGGFVTVAREFAGVELVGIESPLGSKAGSGSGWLTHETFEHFMGNMIADLKTQGDFDGVFLALHGAMGVRGVPQPETEIARRVRAVVGPDAFIAATFDPHGNEDDSFYAFADLGFTVKYYPHYDSYLQGERAARTLIRTLRGQYQPTHYTVKVPIISPTVLQWTGASPWSDLVQRCLVWESTEPDTYVNFFYGFPWSDVPDVGMCFQVTTNGKPELAEKIAMDLAHTAWRQREALLNTTQIHPIAEGVSLAAAALESGAYPVVIADHSDRSGYATWTLQEIIKQDLSDALIVTVADRDAIATLVAGGVKPGDAFDMPVGGRVADSAGDPVRIVGTVATVTPGLGRSGKDETWVSVKFGRNNLLVISPFLKQIIQPEPLRELGITLEDYKVFVIKSRVHFRRGFDDNAFAKTILIVEPTQNFLGTVRLQGLPYEHVNLQNYYPYGDVSFP